MCRSSRHARVQTCHWTGWSWAVGHLRGLLYLFGFSKGYIEGVEAVYQLQVVLHHWIQKPLVLELETVLYKIEGSVNE